MTKVRISVFDAYMRQWVSKRFNPTIVLSIFYITNRMLLFCVQLAMGVVYTNSICFMLDLQAMECI